MHDWLEVELPFQLECHKGLLEGYEDHDHGAGYKCEGASSVAEEPGVADTVLDLFRESVIFILFKEFLLIFPIFFFLVCVLINRVRHDEELDDHGYAKKTGEDDVAPEIPKDAVEGATDDGPEHEAEAGGSFSIA